MRRRIYLLALIPGLMVAVTAGTAFALTQPGQYDPGPYTACVNTRTGAVRMVDVLAGPAPWPQCNSAKEYSVAWANGFSVKDYTISYYGEHATSVTWFHQLACPAEGWEPLGGGGAFLPDEQGAAQMALQASVPTTDEDLGGLHGWEVMFVSVDGLAHTGEFQVYATCAPAGPG